MTVIVNYGLGNIASVFNMVKKTQKVAKVSSDIAEIAKASHIILPGVGAFDHGVRQLELLGLSGVLREKAKSGTPILGICLGMQLLSNGSEEGKQAGLGLINARFKRFSFPSEKALCVPHVGWNITSLKKESPLIKDAEGEQRFYFVHSYHAVCESPEDIIATTTYGFEFPSVYGNGNVFGVQFHPEKSHKFGFHLIRNFLDIGNA